MVKTLGIKKRAPEFGGITLHISLGFKEDKGLDCIFIKAGKSGTFESATGEVFGKLCTKLIRLGVKPVEVAKMLRGIHTPGGAIFDKEGTFNSFYDVVGYVFQELSNGVYDNDIEKVLVSV